MFTAIIIIRDCGEGRISLELAETPSLTSLPAEAQSEALRQSTALRVARHIVNGMKEAYRPGQELLPPVAPAPATSSMAALPQPKRPPPILV